MNRASRGYNQNKSFVYTKIQNCEISTQEITGNQCFLKIPDKWADEANENFNMDQWICGEIFYK